MIKFKYVCASSRIWTVQLKIQTKTWQLYVVHPFVPPWMSNSLVNNHFSSHLNSLSYLLVIELIKRKNLTLKNVSSAEKKMVSLVFWISLLKYQFSVFLLLLSMGLFRSSGVGFSLWATTFSIVGSAFAEVGLD